MDTPLPSELYAFLIRIFSALAVAVLLQFALYRFGGVKREGEAGGPLKFFAGWLLAGIVAGGTYYGMGFLTDRHFTPEIAIESPIEGEQLTATIGPDGGYFMVAGTSSNVVDNGDLRIVLLVHSTDPFTEGWWAQAAPVTEEKSGRWTSIAWLGRKEYPPVEGQKYEMTALVVRDKNVRAEDIFRDPHELPHEARSQNVSFQVVELIPEK
ncbi:hypothetical protein CHL67_05710 [Prosthecochloris sp. GSB1]|uniref:hypothetical protein n=1 Tax=Prosthecochloris sp. GSB1 TaxID=281093 RepID=UPI000B8CDC22|nr:hypothetical protein [Prosthecochloris sp. GSB1]ASQ90484.1 hypothetical protein CHL67_05710 [Prosthecochloris sp. GSB1]